MSRLDRGNIWSQWFGNDTTHICPSCQKVTMRQEDSQTWQVEHIFKMSKGGPDIYPNVIPICVDCNSKNRPYENTFQYMVCLGVITHQQYNTEIESLRQRIHDWNADPNCTQNTKKGHRCTRNRVGKDEIYCAQHLEIENQLYGPQLMDWEYMDESPDEEYTPMIESPEKTVTFIDSLYDTLNYIGDDMPCGMETTINTGQTAITVSLDPGFSW
jgi:hypothetical protein